MATSGDKRDMDTLNFLMIRHLFAPTLRCGPTGVFTSIAAAIAACEARTMGMGLHRSDGRNAGLFDSTLVQIGQMVEAALPILA